VKQLKNRFSHINKDKINIINDEHGFPVRKLMGFVVCVLESREILFYFILFFVQGEKQMD
jgi:hypothetical protein